MYFSLFTPVLRWVLLQFHALIPPLHTLSLSHYVVPIHTTTITLWIIRFVCFIFAENSRILAHIRHSPTLCRVLVLCARDKSANRLQYEPKWITCDSRRIRLSFLCSVLCSVFIHFTQTHIRTHGCQWFRLGRCQYLCPCICVSVESERAEEKVRETERNRNEFNGFGFVCVCMLSLRCCGIFFFRCTYVISVRPIQRFTLWTHTHSLIQHKYWLHFDGPKPIRNEHIVLSCIWSPLVWRGVAGSPKRSSSK